MVQSMKRTAKPLKHLKNALFEISLKETNVLSVDITGEMEYDTEDVAQLISNIKFIAQSKKYLVLVDAGPLSTFTYNGIKLLAQPDSSSYAYAKAYIIHTIAQRLMLNVYQRFFKPSIPIKFFKDKREAELWLLKKFRHLYK